MKKTYPRYRIKQVEDMFYPQIKRRFWPFWTTTYKHVEPGICQYPESATSLAAARQMIERHKQVKKKPRVMIHGDE